MIKGLTITFALIILAGFVLVVIKYETHKISLNDQPPHFDLFIDEWIFGEPTGSLFDTVPEHLRRPALWNIQAETFEVLDTLILSFTNASNDKRYYESWGAPLTRVQTDMIIYRSGYPDSIKFGGFGCATGVIVAPLQSNETMSRIIFNPLMYNPYNNYELELSSDSLPEVFREIYGDSVALRFAQATYALPWSNYKPQLVFTPYFVIKTDNVIRNWQSGNYMSFPSRSPTMEEHFGLRNFPQ